MKRGRVIPLIVLAVLGVAAGLWLRRSDRVVHYTGFVEGEERVLRSEVAGRALEVAFGEGDTVPAGAAVARLDDADVAARIASKQHELAVLEAQIRSQEAALAETQARATLADRTHARQQQLRRSGVASPQQLDEARAQRDATGSAVLLAGRQVEVLHEQLALARGQLAELEVLHAKYTLRAPDVETVVQSKLLWPGELAQPGTAVLSVLDPRDKYVQIYVPVADAGRVRVGTRVEIELDSRPGERVPGEVTFVADTANFTPEKIETRSDRLGQVYRAKVRILEGVERFAPGTEGNVYVSDEAAGHPAQQAAR